MAYDWKPFSSKIKEVEEWLVRELSSIRTGRASPAILDSVTVSAYGTLMKLREVAAISIEDARTIRISPWDASQGKDIAEAITNSGLGLAIAVDDKGVRVSFPQLTAERRVMLLKVGKEKLEEARKKLRVHRDDVWKDIQEKEKGGGMSEDEKFRLKDEMEKITHKAQEAFEGLFAKKEKEISE